MFNVFGDDKSTQIRAESFSRKKQINCFRLITNGRQSYSSKLHRYNRGYFCDEIFRPLNNYGDVLKNWAKCQSYESRYW